MRGATSVKVDRFDIGVSATRGDLASDTTVTTLSAAPKTTLGNGLELGAFLDITKVDDVAETEVTHYGLSAAMPVGDLALAGYVGLGKWDAAGVETETDVYGVSASYDLKGRFDVTAFYNVEAADLGDVEERGVSLGYDLRTRTPMRLVTSITEVEQAGVKHDQVGVSLSLALGKKGNLDKVQRSPSAHSPLVNASFMTMEAAPAPTPAP